MTKAARFLTVCIFLSPGLAFALDPKDEAALRDTKALLSNETALANFTKGNPAAAGALDQVNQLTKGDPAQKQEMNAITSSVFESVVKQSNGDPAEIQNKLALALKDPGEFMKTLSPEQQARIQGLAAAIDKQRVPASK